MTCVATWSDGSLRPLGRVREPPSVGFDRKEPGHEEACRWSTCTPGRRSSCSVMARASGSPRATVKRSRTEIRVRTADGGWTSWCPPRGTDCLTYDASEERPEPIVQLVNAIDRLRGELLGARSPKATMSTHDALSAFCKKHRIKRLSLFGSVVRDDFGPQSDVDILYEPESGHLGTLGSFVAANAPLWQTCSAARVDFHPAFADREQQESAPEAVHFLRMSAWSTRMGARDSLGCSHETDGQDVRR